MSLFFIRSRIFKMNLWNYKIFMRDGSNSNSSQYTCQYSNELDAAINNQILSEHQAAIDYLNMAVSFFHPNIAYPGTGGFFMKMYRNELKHMEVLINYQLIRGGTPTLNIVNRSSKLTEVNLMVEAFVKALKMEKSIMEQLKNIVSIAESVPDHQCAEFITSKFLKEQIYSIQELSYHIVALNRLCDNNLALWEYDKHLSNSYPYAIKI